MDYRVIIPARRHSTRLPGKPLVNIAGVPMIVRTYRQCKLAVPNELISIATDDDEIAEVCRADGADVVMTSSDCFTGTDRVAEAAESRPADFIINVQGDEPIIEPSDITAMIEAASKRPDEMHLGITEMDEEHFRNTSVIKAVFRDDMRLLYASRNSIPSTKRGEFKRAWRPIWVYGFPLPLLRVFVSTGRRLQLEGIEDIEILRMLEMGYDVRLVPMSPHSIAVDTPLDVERVEEVLRNTEAPAGKD